MANNKISKSKRKRKPTDPKQVQGRFFDKVRKTSSCWLWTASTSTNGYGQFRFLGGYWRAHRVSYYLFVGKIPKGLKVLHTCDVKTCVNPDHLFLGTNKENTEDMIKKGRDRFRLPHLEASDVLAIRRDSEGGTSVADLATHYGVNARSIRDILKRRTWRHL